MQCNYARMTKKNIFYENINIFLIHQLLIDDKEMMKGKVIYTIIFT